MTVYTVHDWKVDLEGNVYHIYNVTLSKSFLYDRTTRRYISNGSSSYLSGLPITITRFIERNEAGQVGGIRYENSDLSSRTYRVVS